MRKILMMAVLAFLSLQGVELVPVGYLFWKVERRNW